MADEPRTPSSPDEPQGTDWEEAFQADDFVLSPTEQAASTLMQEGLADGQEPAPAASRPTAGRPKMAGLVGRLLANRRLLLLAVGGLVLLLVAVAGGLFVFRQPAQVAEEPPPAPQPGGMPAGAGQEAWPPPSSPPAGEAAAPPSSSATPKPATGPASQPMAATGADRPLDLPPPMPPDRERRKIRLAGFMIDVADERGGGPRYVAVDCSLVVHMAPEEEFPLSRRYMVRDAIYQFFANRPYYELKRYALARGELKRKLLAWLRKEWPDSPIDTIVFHQYSLL